MLHGSHELCPAPTCDWSTAPKKCCQIRCDAVVVGDPQFRISPPWDDGYGEIIGASCSAIRGYGRARQIFRPIELQKGMNGSES